MLQISIWARQHKYVARAIIVFIKVSLAFIAFWIADSLLALKLELPGWVPATAIFLFMASAFYYPSKEAGKKNFATSFTFRKSCDFILGAATFVMFICLLQKNYAPHSFQTLNGVYAASNAPLIKSEPPTAAEILKSLENGRDKNTLTRKEKKILKQEFKKQIKIWIAATIAGDKEKKGKAWLIILAVIGAVGLLFLLTALVCNLSCNGAEGAAIAVGLAGTALIVWGLIAVIRSINKGRKAGEANPEN